MEVLDGVTPQVAFVKVVNDELVELMGSAGSKDLEAPAGGEGAPQVVLLAGLQGVGKTTAAGKLAMFLAKRRKKVGGGPGPAAGGFAALRSARRPQHAQHTCRPSGSPPQPPTPPTPQPPNPETPHPPQPPTPHPLPQVLLVATDVYRPAAVDQLVKLGSKIGVPVYEEGTAADPVDIAARGVAKAAAEGYDAVIVDTAGRLQVWGGGGGCARPRARAAASGVWRGWARPNAASLSLSLSLSLPLSLSLSARAANPPPAHLSTCSKPAGSPPPPSQPARWMRA